MKIVFCANDSLPIYPNILEERPLGGVETAVVRLAEALQELGHEVIVLTRMQSIPPSRPLYLPMAELQRVGECDVFIGVRGWRTAATTPIKAKKRMLWTGDSYLQSSTLGLGDPRIIALIDRLLCVSDWHARTLCEVSGFPPEKTWVLRNGIKAALFEGNETRVKKRLIYSTIPYRGLQHLIYIFPELLKLHPEAELRIFSGYGVYQGDRALPQRDLLELEQMKREFAGISNVEFHDNILQKDLAREMMRASVLAYPCNVEETSCITAMEAQAGGCAVVTSRKGGLSETVTDAGILIDGNPGTQAYDSAFFQAVHRLLSDEGLWSRMSEAGLCRAREEFDWKRVAEGFCHYLESEVLGYEYG